MTGATPLEPDRPLREQLAEAFMTEMRLFIGRDTEYSEFVGIAGELADIALSVPGLQRALARDAALEAECRASEPVEMYEGFWDVDEETLRHGRTYYALLARLRAVE